MKKVRFFWTFFLCYYKNGDSMKITNGDNFCEIEKYKLYRTVYDLLHPTISKKNISNYKVVLDEKLLPVVVFYPDKMSSSKSIILYVVGDGKVNGCFGKYSEICKNLAKKTNSIVLAIDYFNGTIKYPTVVNKITKVIKYLYDEFSMNGIDSSNITLMGDSVGCKIMGSVVVKLIDKNIDISKLIMFYPVVRDSYIDYKWNESLMSVNFNLDKNINNYLSKYLPKDKDVNCNLLELVYYKGFPKTLVVTGDMDIFKEDGELLSNNLINNNGDSKYINIKFAAHGFLNSVDEEIVFETYKAINDFIL